MARTRPRTWVESVRCRPRLQPPPGAAAVQHGVEQAPFSTTGKEASAELGKDGAVEPGVGQVEGEGVLPVDAAADGIGGLAVGEVFDELEDGDEGQTPGGLGGPAARRVEGSEVAVGEDGAELVAQGEVDVVTGEGGAGHARGFIWNRHERLGSQGHGRSRVV